MRFHHFTSHSGVNRHKKITAGPKLDPRADNRKKGTWRGAKFPLRIAMVPKAGFEPARVSPPPPQAATPFIRYYNRFTYQLVSRMQ
jgi:hypothetical protein